MSIRTIGSGIMTICGSTGMFFSQYLVAGAIEKVGNAFFLVVIIMFFGIIAYIFIPETLGEPMKDQI